MSALKQPQIERVVVINDASVSEGGASALALLSARLAFQAGLSVTYICGDDRLPNDVPNGIDIVTLGDRPLLTKSAFVAAREGLWNFRASQIRRWIEKFDTPSTVYHVHNWQQILSPSLFHALKPVRRRAVLHAHDFALACPTSTFYDVGNSRPCDRKPYSAACIGASCDKRSGFQKVWRTLRLATAWTAWGSETDSPTIVLLCDQMRPFFRRAGYRDASLRIIRNPAMAFVPERIEAERNRELLFVGRVSSEKGVEDVATAANRVGLTLRVVGDGPLREDLSARFQNVICEGWADREGLARIARSARLLVAPSHLTEPFGLVFAEAAASGIPVVMSPHSLLSSEFVKCGAGWTAEAGDIDGLTDLLRRLSADNAAVEQASKAGFNQREAIARSPEDWGRALIGLYMDVLNADRARAAPRASAHKSNVPGFVERA